MKVAEADITGEGGMTTVVADGSSSVPAVVVVVGIPVAVVASAAAASVVLVAVVSVEAEPAAVGETGNKLHAQNEFPGHLQRKNRRELNVLDPVLSQL